METPRTLEQVMIMNADQIDDLISEWGMDDIDRALQNMELERMRLETELAQLRAELEQAKEFRRQISDLIRAMDMQSKQVVQGDGTVTGYQWNTGLWHKFMALAGGALPLTPEQLQGLKEFENAVQRDVIEPLERRRKETMYGECPRCGRALGANHVC